MVKRRLPLNPSLEQLKNQARDLLEAYVSGDGTAVVDFQAFHPRGVTRDVAKLTDAQLVLARTYDFQSWSRLRLGAELSRAISNDALEEIRRLVAEHPELLVEQVRGEDSSWGPPLSFAANLGKQPVIDLLIELGADDVQSGGAAGKNRRRSSIYRNGRKTRAGDGDAAMRNGKWRWSRLPC